MANAYKVLGQAAPVVNVLTDVYTVPGGASAVVSSILVCNRGVRQDDASSFRISVAPGGAADHVRQYVYYDTPLDGEDSFMTTGGFTLESGDVVRVESANGLMSFNVFGTEIS